MYINRDILLPIVGIAPLLLILPTHPVSCSNTTMSTPTTFTLLSLRASSSPSSFLSSLTRLQPLWLGCVHFWIHKPHSSPALPAGKEKWDYLLVSLSANTTNILEGISPFLERSWSVTAPTSGSIPHPTPAETKTLEPGWSPPDPSAFVGASPKQGATLTLNDALKTSILSATDLGSQTPVAMFNLLSYHPNKRETYFKYVSAFNESVGTEYGGEAMMLGLGVTKGENWEDCALIGYPSVWHFAKMLDDEAYAEVDRKYKVGVVRDNPILCCTEVRLG